MSEHGLIQGNFIYDKLYLARWQQGNLKKKDEKWQKSVTFYIIFSFNYEYTIISGKVLD